MRSLRKNGPGVTGKRSNQADPKLPPGDVRDRHGRPLLKLNLKGYWVRTYGKRAKLRVVE